MEKFEYAKHRELWEEMYNRAEEFAEEFKSLKVVQDDLKTFVFLQKFKEDIIKKNWGDSEVKNSCYACQYDKEAGEGDCSLCPFFTLEVDCCKKFYSPWKSLCKALFRYSQNGEGLADIKKLCEEIRDYPLNIYTVIKDLEKECNITIRSPRSYWEIEFHSNAGEDCVFNVFNMNEKDEVAGLIAGLRELYEDFDPEENVSMWLEKKKGGDTSVPSVFVLVEDAKWIENKLSQIAETAESRWVYA